MPVLARRRLHANAAVAAGTDVSQTKHLWYQNTSIQPIGANVKLRGVDLPWPCAQWTGERRCRGGERNVRCDRERQEKSEENTLQMDALT